MKPFSSSLPAVLLLAWGCGVPSYDFSPADASHEGDTASPARGDASRDGNPRGDAGRAGDGDVQARPRDAGCEAGAVEDCTNGMDDDCDGLVDCEDPACSGDGGAYSCTALPTESGWSLVAFQQGSAACPANFGPTQTPVYTSVSGDAFGCGCNCSNVTPAKCVGNWAWMTDGPSSCGTVPSTGGNPVDDGQCQNSANVDNLATTDLFQGAPNGVKTVPGSCSASAAVTQMPLTHVSGEICALPAFGGGCGLDAVCAPRVPPAFSRCSLSSSQASCPTGFDQTSLVTSYTDTRGCSGCSCGTVDLGCNVTGMRFFADAGCSGGSYDMKTGCTEESGLPGGNSASFQADLYTSASGTDCTVTSPSLPTGSVTTSGAEIVCCEPN